MLAADQKNLPAILGQVFLWAARGHGLAYITAVQLAGFYGNIIKAICPSS